MACTVEMKPRVAVAVLAAAWVSAGCAMMEPKAERYVPPPLGSTFTTAQRNTGSFGSGDVQVQSRRGERTWEGKPLLTFESPQGTTLMNSEGAFVASLTPGGQLALRWDPPQGFDFPLEVGKTWSRSTRMIDAKDKSIPYTTTCKVLSHEDVKVPAGTFKAFKVNCTGTLGGEDNYWFSPDLGIFAKQSSKRPATHPFGTGTREAELVSQNIRP